MTDQIVAGRAALHMWEEPCISGTCGSGTVFFSGCELGCVFCQNREIAEGRAGVFISEEELIEAFLRLERQGAWNINLVTATHFVPTVAACVRAARERGLTIPIVYNTGSYDTPETIRALEGVVDVFLPDFKFWEAETARRFAKAPDYPEAAMAAIDEMVRMTGPCVFDADGRMVRGTIVRHLVLPGHVREAKSIISYLAETYGDGIYLSLMNQYTPMPGIEARAEELTRRVTKREYEKVIDHAISLGLTNVYIQEGGTASESFIPAFNGEGLK